MATHTAAQRSVAVVGTKNNLIFSRGLYTPTPIPTPTPMPTRAGPGRGTQAGHSDRRPKPRGRGRLHIHPHRHYTYNHIYTRTHTYTYTYTHTHTYNHTYRSLLRRNGWPLTSLPKAPWLWSARRRTSSSAETTRYRTDSTSQQRGTWLVCSPKTYSQPPWRANPSPSLASCDLAGEWERPFMCTSYHSTANANQA